MRLGADDLGAGDMKPVSRFTIAAIAGRLGLANRAAESGSGMAEFNPPKPSSSVALAVNDLRSK